MRHLRSYKLAVQFYGQAMEVSLPGPLGNQLQRAASSIALNLAEGTGRSGVRDRLRFFTIAMGSIRECQAVIDLKSQKFSQETKRTLDHLAASTYKLIKNTPGP